MGGMGGNSVESRALKFMEQVDEAWMRSLPLTGTASTRPSTQDGRRKGRTVSRESPVTA